RRPVHRCAWAEWSCAARRISSHYARAPTDFGPRTGRCARSSLPGAVSAPLNLRATVVPLLRTAARRSLPPALADSLAVGPGYTLVAGESIERRVHNSNG